MSELTPLSETLVVQPWIDEVVERHGFPPDSPYVEHCWLPLIGPSATWAYRRLAFLVMAGGPIELDTVEFSLALGLGSGLGRQAPVCRTVGRLVMFGLAEWRDDELFVRRAVAPLTMHRLSRLPGPAQGVHDLLMAARV